MARRLRVRVRLRPDAGADRQHRPVPAVRDRADPVHLPQGRARPGQCARPDPDHRGRRAGTGAGPARLRDGCQPDRRRRPSRTCWPVTCSRWPARSPPFYEACPVLKAPDPRLRDSQARPVRAGTAGAADRARPARHPGAGPDVAATGSQHPPRSQRNPSFGWPMSQNRPPAWRTWRTSTGPPVTARRTSSPPSSSGPARTHQRGSRRRSHSARQPGQQPPGPQRTSGQAQGAGLDGGDHRRSPAGRRRRDRRCRPGQPQHPRCSRGQHRFRDRRWPERGALPPAARPPCSTRR